MLDLDLIRLDGGTQSRAQLDMATVADYAAAMGDGATFPPIVVYHDGSDYWLADGFHRALAARQLGLCELEADVRTGTVRDARLHSCGANARHGLRRTNADKRRAVLMLLEDEEWRRKSDDWIAEHAGVSRRTVIRIRQDAHVTKSQVETADGRVMDTTNIGRRAEPAPAPAPAPPSNPDLWRHAERPSPAPAPEPEPSAWSSVSPEQVAAARANLLGGDAPRPPSEPDHIAPLSPPATTPSELAAPSPVAALKSSASVEWYTPEQYLDSARQVLGGRIDLDPASSADANRVVRAERIFTEGDNGLAHDWWGTVWLNPPYGRTATGESAMATWSQRLLSEYDEGRVEAGILLVNANTEAKWFQRLWKRWLCFTDHRIQFVDTAGERSQPTHGNVFCYVGPHPERFANHFGRWGTVIEPAGWRRGRVVG